MNYDLIVVGGGISGIYFIYQYLKLNKNKKILLVESRTRLGGRILTANNNGEIYEIGAGRFSDKHVLLNSLLRELNLEDKIVPISSQALFISKEGESNPKLKFDKVLSKVLMLIKQNFKKEKYESLYHNTLYKILKELDSVLAYEMNHIYSYYSELHVMNAHDALESFKNDFKTTTPYKVLKGGLGQVVVELEQKIKDKVKIILGDGLIDLDQDKDKLWKLQMSSGKEYYTSSIVLALPQKPLSELPILKPIFPLLKKVSGQPLYRIYAKFEENWLSEKIITDSSLKFIIPMNSDGLVMISYTDGLLTKKWIDVIVENKLEEKLMFELKKVFPNINIPKIIWTDASGYWEVGAHYWKPRQDWLDQDLLIKKINNPMDNLYIIGEAFSSNQAWIEGSLKTSSMALENFKNNPKSDLKTNLKSDFKGNLKGDLKGDLKGVITINNIYTKDDVIKHNKMTDAWIIIRGKVYNITEWISKHPGGNIIMKGVGKDATELFIKFAHSPMAEKILKKYYIGDLSN